MGQRPLRVVMAAPYYLPRVGGVERHVSRLAAQLLARGHAVSVIAARHEPGLPPREILGGVPVLRFTPSRFPLLGPLLSGLRLIRFAAALRSADVIHCHDYTTVRWMLLWRLLLPRKRFTVTFHGWEGDCPPKPGVVRQRRLAAALARGNIAVGGFIEKWYGTRATVVTHGAVEPPEPGPAVPSDVLLVSRLDPDVPVLEYVEGFAALSRAGGAREIIVLGGGTLFDAAREKAAALGVAIRFLGPVPDPNPYYRGARTVVANGFLAMLEAAALGIPVFALQTNPIMADRARLFPHAAEFIHLFDSPAAFGAALAAHLARDPSEGAVPAPVVAWARAQTWDRLADQYEELWAR